MTYTQIEVGAVMAIDPDTDQPMVVEDFQRNRLDPRIDFERIDQPEHLAYAVLFTVYGRYADGTCEAIVDFTSSERARIAASNLAGTDIPVVDLIPALKGGN